MHVCMYICMYACMHMCMHAYMYVFTHVCVYISVHAFMYVCIYVGMFVMKPWRGWCVDLCCAWWRQTSCHDLMCKPTPSVERRAFGRNSEMRLMCADCHSLTTWTCKPHNMHIGVHPKCLHVRYMGVEEHIVNKHCVKRYARQTSSAPQDGAH